MQRQLLSQKYMTGLGLEIGPGKSPWVKVNSCKVKYLDKDPKLTVDYRNLSEVPSYTFDFLCSSHQLEHVEDPIGEIKEWLRVLKPMGYIIIALPNKDMTFDRPRQLTPFEHLFLDYMSPQSRLSGKRGHYEEFALCTEPPQANIDALMACPNYGGIHYHCWDLKTFRTHLDIMSHLLQFKILHYTPEWIEVFAVLKKEKPNG